MFFAAGSSEHARPYPSPIEKTVQPPKRGPARYGLEPSHGYKHMILRYLFDCCSTAVRELFDNPSTALRQVFDWPSTNLRQRFGKMPKHKRTAAESITCYIRTNPERLMDAPHSIFLRDRLRNGLGA